ncbi:hypothetical protein [Brevibacillus sp. NRS-1366]|uniref:hypothetical protein n=1 Tax=Brevibacillus sp. NRS-1366 TaxID=3233899 RepID=UPI003D1C4BC6
MVNTGYKQEGVEHPEVQKAINQFYEVARQKNVPLGTIASSASGVRQELQKGTAFIPVVTTAVFMSAFSEIVSAGGEIDFTK